MTPNPTKSDLELAIRQIPPLICPNVKPLTTLKDVKLEKIYGWVRSVLKCSKIEQEIKGRRKPQAEYNHSVNFKRRNFAAVLLSSKNRSLKSIAQQAGVNPATAKKLLMEMQIKKNISLYSYTHKYSETDIQSMKSIIKDKHLRFSSLSHYKRAIYARAGISVSKKKIRKLLLDSGRRWRSLSLRRTGWKALSETETHYVGNIFLETFFSNIKHLIAFDQIKIPLSQIPSKAWLLKKEEVLEHRKTVNEITLTCCIACSEHGYIGMVVYEKEMKAEDTIYLLKNLLNNLNVKGQIVLWCDNAPWHANQKVWEDEVSQYIKFNISGHPELNPIEGSFSKVRELARRRLESSTVSDEIRSLAADVLGFNSKERVFTGHYRNVLRALLGHSRRFNTLVRH